MTSPAIMRKLGCFVALSLLVHLWFIYGMPFEMPRLVAAPRVLEARLQPAPPLPPVLPRVQPASAREPVAASPPAVATPDASAWTEMVTPSLPEPARPDTTEAPAVAPPAAADNPPVAQPVPPLARRLPRKGEIVYALYLGTDRFNVGRTIQNWEISGDRYRLGSVSETTGLAALFSRQRLAYESRGRLTAAGLQPEHFTMQRVRSGTREDAAAEFDWRAATALVGNPARRVELPAGTQDIVSFMYQLGLAPLTPGRIELPITNGWKLERYELEIGIEELLETPLGALRAVPVKQVRHANQETIELWLAPAYRWLPVRIRFYNRDGEPSGEQIASEIRVSEE